MNGPEKKQLEEINVIRPVLICVCLVMYHSFAPFGGANAWHLDGISSIDVYFWIDKLVYSFMLELFVFISGYVFASQITDKKINTFKGLLKGKFRRLIIPSIFFSLLYSIFFYDKTIEPLQFVFDILSGQGHMWFLPMLFWCFIAAYFIEKIKINEYAKIVFLFFLSLLSFFPIPLQLGQTCYYLFFFYLAFPLYRNRSRLLRITRTPWITITVLLIYLVSFVYFTIIRKDIISYHPVSITDKIIKMLLYKSTMLFYSLFGVVGSYLVALKIANDGFKSPRWLLELNKLCMGVYIAHQFVLMALYYHTDIVILAGDYWFPWLGYGITLILSLTFAYIVRLTSIGRKFI